MLLFQVIVKKYHIKNKPQQDIMWDIVGDSAIFVVLSVLDFYIFLFTKSVLKEQWIRAKYERKEFVDGAPEPPYLKGTLWANLQMCTH